MNYKPFKTVVRIWDGNMNGGLCRYLDALRDLGCGVHFSACGWQYRDDIKLEFRIDMTNDPQAGVIGHSIGLGTRVIFLHGKSGRLLEVLTMTQEEAEDFLVEDKPVETIYPCQRLKINRNWRGEITGVETI